VLKKVRDGAMPLLWVIRVKPDLADASDVKQEMNAPNHPRTWRKHMKAQPDSQIEPRDGEPRRGASEVTGRIAKASPRFQARMAGVFQFFEGLTSAGGEVAILGGLVVTGSATATAANILAHEQLFWLGFASSLIAVAFHLVWALLFYDLFKPVNRRISLLATFVILVGCAMQALTSLFYLAPLLVLQGGHSFSAFTPQQLQALALVFLNLNSAAFNIYLVFFGLWCVLIGYLIFRSTFLPRILGVLLAIDGLGWMLFLSPPLALYLFPLIAVASGLAEIPLMLWLIVVGVNEERWVQQASAAGERQ
jgi:hypothetical protein